MDDVAIELELCGAGGERCHIGDPYTLPMDLKSGVDSVQRPRDGGQHDDDATWTEMECEASNDVHV